MAVFVLGGCMLSSDYTDGEGGDDSGVPPASLLDSGPMSADATPAQDSSSEPPDGASDGAPTDAAPDVDTGGPWGDGCNAIPDILSPAEGGAVGATAQIVMSVPPCLKTLIVYVDGVAATGTVKTDGGFDGSVTVSIPNLGDHQLTLHAWDNTEDAHAAPQVGIDRTQ